MANELLDFVMSLVRDPDAAARYAADPDRALAAAGLSGVTSTDVNNLRPVVSDSLAMTAAPVGAADGIAGNVWTGGAATAAFDAFTPQHTVSSPVAAHQSVIQPAEAVTPQPVADPWFGADSQVNAIDPAPTAWDRAGPTAGDPHVPFEQHAPFEQHGVDDSGFSGFELLD
jgi:hypothetical protein